MRALLLLARPERDKKNGTEKQKNNFRSSRQASLQRAVIETARNNECD
jgi:hypothetical protein